MRTARAPDPGRIQCGLAPGLFTQRDAAPTSSSRALRRLHLTFLTFKCLQPHAQLPNPQLTCKGNESSGKGRRNTFTWAAPLMFQGGTARVQGARPAAVPGILRAKLESDRIACVQRLHESRRAVRASEVACELHRRSFPLRIHEVNADRARSNLLHGERDRSRLRFLRRSPGTTHRAGARSPSRLDRVLALR